MRRIWIFVLIVLLASSTACGSGKNESSTTSSTKSESSSGTSSTDDSPSSPESNTDTSEDDTPSLGDIPSESVSTPVSSAYFGKYGDAYIEDSLLSLQCIAEHPGVPGYDTEYQMKVYYDGLLLRASEYSITCNVPQVKIDGNKVIIPADAKDKLGNYVPITATYLPDKTVKDIYPLRNYKWTETFGDDFNGTEIDSTKWAPMPSYENSPTKWTVNPASAFVENGKLVLLAEKKPYSFMLNGKLCHADYSVGGIETYGKFSQKYGCFMASFKMEEKVGTFSSFWLMPVTRSWGSKFLWKNNKINAFCGEVDIFEHAYKWDGKAMITDHYWYDDGRRASGNSAYYSIDNMYGRYLNWACVWTETGKYIYCDGKLLESQTNLTATGEEAFMMLDIYMGSLEGQTGSIGEWVGYFKDSDLPIRAEVDYVRAYSFR